MKRSFFWILLLGIFSFLSSCGSIDNELIIGSWEGVRVLEEGKELGVNPKEISFYFDKNESYRYKSTLNYKEAGSYYIESSYLFTTDTVNQASTEKAVEILVLSPDSLHIKMDDNGKERILKLTKI
jgi:hypothetical protein